MMAFEYDLRRMVQNPLRDPLRDYIMRGVPVHNRDLHNLLRGDHNLAHVAVHDGDGSLLIVEAFLDCHANHLDICHGADWIVLRWQMLGGWIGRQ